MGNKNINTGNVNGVVNAETGSTINIYNAPTSKILDDLEQCKTETINTSQNIYINREVDRKIEEKINERKGSVIFINGTGGIGKSTLLKEIQHRKNIPSIKININNDTDISMAKVLLDKGQTVIYHCPKFEKKRNELLLSEGKSDEYKLLQALYEDFNENEQGLFIIDTFEKNKNKNIRTKVHFSDDGFELNMEKDIRFRDYLEFLVYHFISRTTFLIGGRTCLSDIEKNKNNELYLAKIDDIIEFTLERFSSLNIENYFENFTTEYIFDKPSKGQLKVIEELTKGNPLLIHSFACIAKDCKGWDNVDFEEMNKKIVEDESYGLLYYFTEKISSYTNNHELWKLVVPRVLNNEVVNLLFENIVVLNSLIDGGLAFNNGNTYYLHDEVYMAILAYAKKELKKNSLSWHDNKKVREVHEKLAKYYEVNKSKNEENNFEACYHKMMMRRDFDFSLNGFSSMKKEDFIHHFLGSLFIGYNEKIETCSNFQSLDKLIIEEKIRRVMSEVEQIIPIMSNKLYDKCLTDIGRGKVKNGIYDITYLKQLLNMNEYKEELELYKFLGQAYQVKKLYKEERTTYTHAIALNLDKEDEYFYLLIGNTYYQEENEAQALFYYKLSLRVNERAETYNNMGTIYARQGEEGEAIKFYKKSLTIKPSEFTYMSLANIYYEKEEYRQSIYLLNQAININSFNALSHQHIANCYREEKEYKKAFVSYKKSLKLNPNNEFTYNHLGILFQNIKQYKDAILWYKKAISLNANDEWIHANIARVYDKINDKSNAKKHYIEAMKINPKNGHHYNHLAHVFFNEEHQSWYLKLRNHNKYNSIDLYRKAIELEPTNSRFYMNLANAYARKNNEDKAIEWYKKVISFNSNNTNAFLRIANIYFEKKNYLIAIKLYQKILMKKNNFYLIYLKLADCYFQLEDYDSAVREYDNLLQRTNRNYKTIFIYKKLMKCYFYQRKFKMMVKIFQEIGSKIHYDEKVRNEQLSEKLELWLDNVSQSMKYLFFWFVGVIGISFSIIFIYLIFRG